jgi:hypothetical protein
MTTRERDKDLKFAATGRSDLSRVRISLCPCFLNSHVYVISLINVSMAGRSVTSLHADWDIHFIFVANVTPHLSASLPRVSSDDPSTACVRDRCLAQLRSSVYELSKDNFPATRLEMIAGTSTLSITALIALFFLHRTLCHRLYAGANILVGRENPQKKTGFILINLSRLFISPLHAYISVLESNASVS